MNLMACGKKLLYILAVVALMEQYIFCWKATAQTVHLQVVRVPHNAKTKQKRAVSEKSKNSIEV